MRVSFRAATLTGAALLAIIATSVQAQTLNVLQPAPGAIVRETVPIRVAPGDLPAGGYVSISVDGNFLTAQLLPHNSHAPVYLWDTKQSGANAVKDGDHTVKVQVYTSDNVPAGSDSFSVRVANQISPPSHDLKLDYHWTTQPRMEYRRTSSMVVPADTTAANSPYGGQGAASADQTLESSDASFQRSTEGATASKTTVRDLVTGGTVTERGQTEPIKTSYNIAPLLREVNADGAILNVESETDMEDHIGFPIPEMPLRRVGKGDSWQAKVEIPLNWNGSNIAHVTAECRLVDFEWQNSYPTAKIQETYQGPAHFAPHGTSVSGHPSPPAMDVSSINMVRTVYFAYGAGRFIKSVTDTTLTLTPTQLSELGGAGPGGMRGMPPMGMPEGMPPMGIPRGMPPMGNYPGGPPHLGPSIPNMGPGGPPYMGPGGPGGPGYNPYMRGGGNRFGRNQDENRTPPVTTTTVHLTATTTLEMR